MADNVCPEFLYFPKSFLRELCWEQETIILERSHLLELLFLLVQLVRFLLVQLVSFSQAQQSLDHLQFWNLNLFHLKIHKAPWRKLWKFETYRFATIYTDLCQKVLSYLFHPFHLVAHVKRFQILCMFPWRDWISYFKRYHWETKTKWHAFALKMFSASEAVDLINKHRKFIRQTL